MAVDRYNRPEYHFGRQPKYYSSLLVLIRKDEIFCHDAARIKMSKIFSRSNKISQYSILKLIIFTFSHTKFQGHRSIWAWRPYWSCDPTLLYKFSFPFSLKLFFFFFFFFSGEPGLVDRVLALHTGSRGFDSHRGHMSEQFFRSNRPGYPHPVSSELENSGIRVATGDCSVTERRRWRPPYQTGKTVHVHANTTNTTRTDTRRRVCAAMVPYR